MKISRLIIALSAGLVLAGCQTTKDAPNLATLGVSFDWQPKHKCSSTPPAFEITNIPASTKTLDFWMTDLNKTSYTHGGGSVEYKGSGSIPEGAFNYKGPCPPSGSHNYEFEVKALNAAGDTVLGRGKAVRAFP